MDHRKHYDIAILRSIEANRIKKWIGTPPDANPHIVIVCGDDDCDEVGFYYKEKS